MMSKSPPKMIDRTSYLIKTLEKEAFKLKREIKKIEDEEKRELAQWKYIKLTLRIKEIKNSTSIFELTRYE